MRRVSPSALETMVQVSPIASGAAADEAGVDALDAAAPAHPAAQRYTANAANAIRGMRMAVLSCYFAAAWPMCRSRKRSTRCQKSMRFRGRDQPWPSPVYVTHSTCLLVALTAE